MMKTFQNFYQSILTFWDLDFEIHLVFIYQFKVIKLFVLHGGPFNLKYLKYFVIIF